MRTEHCTARQGQKKTPLLLVGDEVSQEDQQQRVLAAVRLANTAHMHGVSLENLRDANKDNKINFDSLIEGDAVQLPSGCLTSSVVPACCCAVPARLADVCLR